MILFFTFTIIHSASFNGFTKLATLKGCGLIFSLILAIIEITLYYVTLLISTICVVKIRAHYGQTEPYLPVEQEMQQIA